jgi:hypothetical protein
LKKIWLFSQVCLFLASLLLVLGFWLVVQEFWAAVFFLPSFLWHWGQRRGFLFLDSILLVVYTIIAVIGMLAGSSPILALLAILFALSAWDLGRFMTRLSLVENDEVETRIIRTHLLRLVVLLGIGLLLPLFTFSIRIEIRLGLALLLGFLAIFGLSRLVMSLTKESQ